MRWYSSDHHFGHENIIAYCDRPFDSVEAMNGVFIDNWNTVVAPDDEVIYLGDFAMGQIHKTLPIVARLHGRVTLLCGNHDRPWIGNNSGPKGERWLNEYLEAGFHDVIVGGTLRGFDDGVEMCHFPFTGDSGDKHDRHVEFRPTDHGQWLLHGHTHQTERRKGRMIHVGVDAWNYRPVSEDEIVALMRQSDGS